jgi:DNA mismatch endonuclease (patch repair protein)
MSDIYSITKRSEIMSKISGKDTKPEILIRKFLFSIGFRFRKNDIRLPGKPDIVLPKYNTIIFINGCFWHGHNCKARNLPAIRKDFWELKISENTERDKKNIKNLEYAGWKVLTIWQCELKNLEGKQKTFTKVVNFILRPLL